MHPMPQMTWLVHTAVPLVLMPQIQVPQAPSCSELQIVGDGAALELCFDQY
jgi:hypothetical protein